MIDIRGKNRAGPAWRTPVAVLIVVATMLAAWLIYVDRGAWTARHTVAICIMAPAYILWTTARLQLGRAFAVPARAAGLVTHGLYARIRNPIYLFGELLIIGIFVFLGNPWLFLTVLASIPLQVIRARREARVLDATYGDAYRAYRRRTWI
jgi:protein-S-isoprenylcysteine O-methyltransferase Ste14